MPLLRAASGVTPAKRAPDGTCGMIGSPTAVRGLRTPRPVCSSRGMLPASERPVSTAAVIGRAKAFLCAGPAAFISSRDEPGQAPRA